LKFIRIFAWTYFRHHHRSDKEIFSVIVLKSIDKFFQYFHPELSVTRVLLLFWLFSFKSSKNESLSLSLLKTISSFLVPSITEILN
jgi:hypothetical protein